jgi:chromosome segregation ATPase
MSYITKNANLLLLFLIVLIAASLVGATVYFQARFSKVNDEYTTKLAELENVTKQVEDYRAVLQKTQVELELKQSREEQFTEKYTEAKATTDQLQKTTEELQEQVADLTLDLQTKTEQVSTLTVQVADLQSDLNAAEDDIEELDEKADCLESTADADEGNC